MPGIDGWKQTRHLKYRKVQPALYKTKDIVVLALWGGLFPINRKPHLEKTTRVVGASGGLSLRRRVESGTRLFPSIDPVDVDWLQPQPLVVVTAADAATMAGVGLGTEDFQLALQMQHISAVALL